jgi:hypothetical protein
VGICIVPQCEPSEDRANGDDAEVR